MKIERLLCVIVALLSVCACHTPDKKDMRAIIDEAMQQSAEQYKLMAEYYAEKDTLVPRSYENGKQVDSTIWWWCSGFFPGSLWYLYEYTQDVELRNWAEKYTERIEPVKNVKDHHDVGFMAYCSFGNGLRLTADSTYYNEILLTAAKSLCTRYKPEVGLIRSWDMNKEKWQYPVIIDNMMNLELLCWGTKVTGDSCYRNIAVSHADKTMENHYRSDYSCYHVVSYDTIQGVPHVKQTHQGYSDSSSWSRGQAWGLYGYTMMYRETGDRKYLDWANQIACYLIDRLSAGDVNDCPYWDFDDPDIPNALRDASAASIMASAFIELSLYVDRKSSLQYQKIAEQQLRTLSSSKYRAHVGENGFFILKHSVGSKPFGSEVDVPLTYADYYYLEALLRYKKYILDK